MICIAKTTTTRTGTLSFLLVLLLSSSLQRQGRTTTFALRLLSSSDDLCVNETTGEVTLNGTKVNPNFVFQPLPEPLNKCDQGYCFCKIVGNTIDHLCPWELRDFPRPNDIPSGDDFYDLQRAIGTSTYNSPDNDFEDGASSLLLQNTTHCQGITFATLGSGDKKYGITPAPTITRCGTFIYVQPLPGTGENYYSKGSDMVDCPTSWADVEEVAADHRSGAATAESIFCFNSNNNKASFFVLFLSLGVFVASFQLLLWL